MVKKRPWNSTAPEAKAWFLDFADAIARGRGWTTAQSLQQAKGMAPELFMHVKTDNIRKWRPRRVGPGGGRPNAFSQSAASNSETHHLLLASTLPFGLIFLMCRDFVSLITSRQHVHQ